MTHPTASDELLIDIPQDIEPARWPDCCIYEVPKKLRDVNEKAYNPKLISIGPLHHGHPDLKNMEMQKLRYFMAFCKRTGKGQEDLASIITEDDIEKIHRCYVSDTLKLEGNNFKRMVLLDAIFIIELFLRNINNTQSKDTKHASKSDLVASMQLTMSKEDDYMFSEKWLSYNLRQDLLLLENQLPFFILEKLCKQSNCYSVGSEQDSFFLKLSFAYFYELHPAAQERKPSIKEFEEFSTVMLRGANSGKEVKHFTDLLRYFFYSAPEKKEADGKCTKLSKKFTDGFRKEIFCFCSEDESEAGEFIKHLYSATQLDEAGVKFKRVKHTPLLDIKFKKNLCLKHCPFLNCSWLLNCLPCFTCFKIMQPFLEVPTFEINDETECVFRNLMAFEQCHSKSDPYICNYVLLLDRFINSKEDVDLLVDENVIVNFLGSNKRVATLVNDLCLEIVEPEKSQYMDLSKRLNKHYGNCWNKNMAKLSRKYCGDFWRGTATVVGLTVLVFTLWNFHRLLFRPPKGFKHHE